jgi:hypothetical protein
MPANEWFVEFDNMEPDARDNVAEKVLEAAAELGGETQAYLLTAANKLARDSDCF